MELNPLQQAAVDHGTGPLLVLAGPGTGKTGMLTHRGVHLIQRELAYPAEITIVTFTRKASTEIRERIERLLGQDVADLTISTIDALAYAILYAESGNKPIKVADEWESAKLIGRAIEQVGLDKRVWTVRRLMTDIARAKDRGQTPEDILTRGPAYANLGKVYEAYEKLLAEAGQIDFNDLPAKAVKVLQRDESIAAFHRARARFILVDEFQDTSRSQYGLIKALVGVERNITCVGSPAQAIYAWRGADPDYLLETFRRDFPDAREIVLQENYRSTRAILTAASSVINGKYPDARGLVPRKDAGEPVRIGRFDTEIHMAEYVASQIKRWHEVEPGRHWNECTVLYRTNQQSDAVQAAFAQAQVPYSLPQGQITMLERPEVKHLLAYASLAVNPNDEMALTEIVNIPPRYIGAASLQKIKAGHELVSLDLLSDSVSPENGLRDKTVEGILDLLSLVCDDLPRKAGELSPQEFLSYILDRTGYNQWIAEDIDYYKKQSSIKWLKFRASEHDTVAEFVRAMGVMENQQLETPRGVSLNTIHGVKGLEFPIVFMIGMEEGKLPHRQSLKLHSDPDEERRLCYVGMTRAQERLYLLGSRTERVNGHYERVSPSRYLADIPTPVSARC